MKHGWECNAFSCAHSHSSLQRSQARARRALTAYFTSRRRHRCRRHTTRHSRALVLKRADVTSAVPQHLGRTAAEVHHRRLGGHAATHIHHEVRPAAGRTSGKGSASAQPSASLGWRVHGAHPTCWAFAAAQSPPLRPAQSAACLTPGSSPGSVLSRAPRCPRPAPPERALSCTAAGCPATSAPPGGTKTYRHMSWARNLDVRAAQQGARGVGSRELSRVGARRGGAGHG